MKTCCFLLALLFLVSSCSTYRKFDLEKEEVQLGKTYKIKSGAAKFQKVKIIAYDGEQLAVLYAGNVSRLEASQIDEIKAKKFSTLKTVAVHVVGGVGLLAVAFASWSGPNISVY